MVDIYSVNDCVNDNFTDFVDYWKHNGFWFFDSPEVIKSLAEEHSIDLSGTNLFYYEAFEKEFAEGSWRDFGPSPWLATNVAKPANEVLEGFDFAVVEVENCPDPTHSPLSCNGLAEEVSTNSHCLFETSSRRKRALNRAISRVETPALYASSQSIRCLALGIRQGARCYTFRMRSV